MAIGARQLTFEITLSDVDRGVYEQLTLRPAQHPSENVPYLVTRVLAHALFLEEGLAFSKGLSTTDEPALWTHDLTGQLTTWIDVGTPEAARLHKASKAADRVIVVCHKAPEPWLTGLRGAAIHRADALEVVLLDPAFVASLASTVDRRNTWSLSITEGTLYLETAADSLVTTPERVTL